MAPSTVHVPPPLPVRPPPLDFKDPASHSNPGQVQTRHIHWDLTIDLAASALSASATYTFRVIDADVQHVILDSRGLSIVSVTDLSDNSLSYALDDSAGPLGDALRVTLPSPDPTAAPDIDDVRHVRIAYTTSGTGTSQAAGACDWLPANQAAGRPFVFTQAQAINARSLLPCQDTPAAKAPYSAVVTLDDAHADLQVVMSALRVPTQDGDPPRSARFTCDVPVPSYLIAFAVGKLEKRDLSSRCAVWALPEVIEAAAWEFSDVENMLVAAEKLAGPYVWGRYDLLVLPPSFPYGGMENPMLTFVTPTLLSVRIKYRYTMRTVGSFLLVWTDLFSFFFFFASPAVIADVGFCYRLTFHL